jgi:hypothetical protein
MTFFVKNNLRNRALAGVLATMAICGSVVRGGGVGSKGPAREQSALTALPFYFEANQVRNDGGFPFVARGPGCSFFVSPATAVLSLASSDEKNLRQGELHFEFVGANSGALVKGTHELSGKANYFVGNDPAQWRRGVSLFERVRVEQLYPGVDLVYYGNDNRIEYDFIVAPKVDAKKIAIRFSGADKIQVNASGALEFTLNDRVICQPKPVVYQVVAGERKPVTGEYALTNGRMITFKLGDYDRELPLVIDPVLSYSTFFGGAGIDIARSVKVGKDSFVYVAGETMGGLPHSDITVSNGGFRGGTKLHGDAFVAKFDNGAVNLVYLAYIGGRSNDVALDLAVDDSGNAFITGYTDSTNFPVKNAIQPKISGSTYPGLSARPIDAFVTELDATGTNLVFSTYLGGTWIDEGVGIALDNAGYIYVAGYTESTNGLPVTNVPPEFKTYHTNGDAFVAKFSPGGTNLAYLMYLGGFGLDLASGVAVEKSTGKTFITGYTTSTNFPTTADAIQPRLGGGQDAFVTVLSPDVSETNSGIVMSTYYGGSGHNSGFRIALDAAGNFYVTGETTADPNFPVNPSAINPGGIFRSENGAGNWISSSVGLNSVVVPGLAVDPSNPQNIYAATWHGIAQSLDGGVSWHPATSVVTSNVTFTSAIQGGTVNAVAIDPNAPVNVYAATATEGVFFSTNSGTVWNLGGTGLLSLTVNAVLVVNDAAGNNVYAGTASGVSRSTNGAALWKAANTGIGNVDVRALAYGTNPSTLYAGTANGVFRTINNGTNWFVFNSNIVNHSIQALVVDPVNSQVLYAGSPGGVYKTANRGTNWARLNSGLSTSNVIALAVDPINSATVYAGTTIGLFKSTNGGTNWTVQTNGLITKAVLALAINKENPNLIYAGMTGNVFSGGKDAFVWKGPNGYSAVLGGVSDEEGWDIAVDAQNRAHVTGWTSSTNFPTADTNGILRAKNSGKADAFVAELSSDGGTLLQSAYLGGTNSDYGYAIALDEGGNSYVVGTTLSQNFPLVNAGQSAKNATNDAFLVKILGDAQPSLNISGFTNKVVLSWPSYFGDFNVQYTTNRTVSRTYTTYTTNGANVTTNISSYTNLVEMSTNWLTLPGSVQVSNGLRTITLDATNDSRFFRLKH